MTAGFPKPKPEAGSPKPEPDPEAFYAGALHRMRRIMIVIALTATLAAAFRFGWRPALGFACGSAVAYLNFHWLKRVVTALADRVTQTGAPKSGKGIVLHFLLRYAVMALAAYAILTVSPASLYGLLAGLFLPVAAIACEAAYETYVAVSRGI